LGEEVTKTAEVSSEVTFMIPQFLSYKFTTFFDSFDRDLESIGVRSYGISVPTLENVFLQVTNEK